MTTYPPTPGPPEPEPPEPERRDEDTEGTWGPNSDSDPSEPRPFSGNEPEPAPPDGDRDAMPPGGTPGETPRAPSDEPTAPSDEGWSPPSSGGSRPPGPSDEPQTGIPPAPPPPGTGPAEPPPMGGGYSPYAGGAVPPPPPAPPAYNGDGPLHGQQSRNGLGTAALVCGIVAVGMSFIPVLNWFTWPLGVLAIVFGAVGWGRANKGQATNKTIAIVGLVLGIVSFFTFCLIYIIIGAGSSTMYYDAAPML